MARSEPDEVGVVACVCEPTVAQHLNHVIGNGRTSEVGDLLGHPPAGPDDGNRDSSALQSGTTRGCRVVGCDVDRPIKPVACGEPERQRGIVVFDHREGWIRRQEEGHGRQTQQPTERTRYVCAEHGCKTQICDSHPACGTKVGGLSFEELQHPTEA